MSPKQTECSKKSPEKTEPIHFAETPKPGQCYRFEADLENISEWPSRAVAWLAHMEEAVRARDDLYADRQKLEFYTRNLGYGPATRLMWARKSGQVHNFRTFLEWFKERYIDFVEKNRLTQRYERVRQTGTVHQYILDFERVHRANCQLVPLEHVISLFCKNLRCQELAQWTHAHRSPEMDLEDVMIMAIFRTDRAGTTSVSEGGNFPPNMGILDREGSGNADPEIDTSAFPRNMNCTCMWNSPRDHKLPIPGKRVGERSAPVKRENGRVKVEK